MEIITSLEWRRTSGRRIPDLLTDEPLLITSNGKPCYEVRKPTGEHAQEMKIGQWKQVANWDVALILQRGPMLVLRGKRPLFEARRVSE